MSIAQADLTDNARVLARIRAGLPTHEESAPFIANLYTDLLINDRLQRSAGLNMAGVFQALAAPSQSHLWTFYMRVYEILWSMPRRTLAIGTVNSSVDLDAQLCARLIRSYARDWLEGAGRFAVLCLPYLHDDAKDKLETLRDVLARHRISWKGRRARRSVRNRSRRAERADASMRRSRPFRRPRHSSQAHEAAGRKR